MKKCFKSFFFMLYGFVLFRKKRFFNNPSFSSFWKDFRTKFHTNTKVFFTLKKLLRKILTSCSSKIRLLSHCCCYQRAIRLRQLHLCSFSWCQLATLGETPCESVQGISTEFRIVPVLHCLARSCTEKTELRAGISHLGPQHI